MVTNHVLCKCTFWSVHVREKLPLEKISKIKHVSTFFMVNVNVNVYVYSLISP